MIYEAYLAVAGLFAIGLACMIFKGNLVKKIMGLGIIANSIHIFFITVGYREGSINPIVTPQNVQNFAIYSVDPIPQALVLTAIVIDMCVTSLALMIAIWVHRRFGTAESRELEHLKG
ncbi:MAG TPA: cation:proton antiporter subunit C [archaeon]|jgi:multicomponent Na+:H+ antiporter subunit C|nr:cation:proton antiporter subunit C [archaeon]